MPRTPCPTRDGALEVPEPFQDLSEVLAGLRDLEAAFVAAQDRRGVFTLAYRIVTETLGEWLAGGRFEDCALVDRYATRFANAYRRALVEDTGGRPERVPAAWRLCFRAARGGRDGVVRDLLTGINAHVNRDLPFVILDAGIDPASEACHRDHDTVNDALRAAMPTVRVAVARRYTPRWTWAARLAGPRLDRVLDVAFRRARENAWRAAARLDQAEGPPERERLARRIEERALARGEAILASRSGLRAHFRLLYA